MALLPVICDSCKRLWFAPKPRGVPGPARFVFKSVDDRPCPYCGSNGTIPDRLYALSQGATRVVASLSRSELKELRLILESAQRYGESAEATIVQIESRVPRAAPIAPLLTHEGAAAASWLNLLVAIVSLIFRFAAQEKATPLTSKRVAQIAATAAKELQADNRPPPTTTDSRTQCRPADPCWCGSERKYKHCHGQLARR